jgi:hypothetical protein
MLDVRLRANMLVKVKVGRPTEEEQIVRYVVTALLVLGLGTMAMAPAAFAEDMNQYVDPQQTHTPLNWPAGMSTPNEACSVFTPCTNPVTPTP